MTDREHSPRYGNPWHLTPLEVLLQGGPYEFMDVWSPHQVEADIRPGVSDRQLMTELAARWADNLVLYPDERARIRAVWLDGEKRPAYNLATDRRDELRALVRMP